MDEGTVTTRSPARSHIIERPRLTTLLDESGARIILLVAPAGYGKTTLARQWTSRLAGPTVWYRTTRRSSDLAAFAYGLAAALDGAVAGSAAAISDRIATMAAFQRDPHVLARAIASGGTTWPDGLVVVLEDYHHAMCAPDAEEFVEALVAELPARFLLTSRVRPAWAGARLTLYGELAELGVPDLRLTEVEAEEALGGVPADLARTVVELAHGWPVVIGLAATTGRWSIPDGMLSRELYAFLAEDLLASVSADVQEALNLVALSGVADQRLARELVEPDGDRKLGEAHDGGLLTLEATGELSIHPLLREFLLSRLQDDPPDDMDADVDALLAGLLARRCWDECLTVAECFPRPALFNAVFRDALPELLRTGRVATVQRWVELARSASVEDPLVDLADGELAIRVGDLQRAIALAGHAAERLTDGDTAARAHVLAGRAMSFSELRTLALRHFEAAERTACAEDLRRTGVWGQFLIHHDIESDTARTLLLRFASLGDRSVNKKVRLAHGHLLLGALDCRLTEALESATITANLLPMVDDPIVRSSYLNALLYSLTLSSHYEDALRVATDALDFAAASGLSFAISYALVSKAAALIGLRRFVAAQRTLGQLAARLTNEPNAFHSANLAIQTARLRLSLGDLPGAADMLVLDPAEDLSKCCQAEYHGYRALVLAALGEHHTLERHLASARVSKSIEARSLVLLSQAILSTRGSCPNGDERVLDVFDWVWRAGNHDALLMACRSSSELAACVATSPERADSLTKLFLRSSDYALARRAGLSIPRSLRRTGRLSPRESEIYDLLVQGLTNGEISRALFISESTTKVHVRHIFEKLGVRSRIEAAQAWSSENDLG